MNEIQELKRLKKETGLSYEKMAREIGISWRSLYRWLKGNSLPSDLALKAIKKYLDNQGK